MYAGVSSVIAGADACDIS